MNNDDLLKSAKTMKEEKYCKRHLRDSDEKPYPCDLDCPFNYDGMSCEDMYETAFADDFNNDEPAWMTELDRKYEEMWLEKWGKDEDYIKFLQAQKSLREASLNEENEEISDILEKSIELVEASKVFFEKIRESRPRVRIKIS